MMRKMVVCLAALAFAITGCSKIAEVSKVKEVIVKDIALEDQDMLIKKYVGSVAWTRVPMEDLTERENPGEPKKRIIPRDTKITIVDINFAYNGALIVDDPKGRRIVSGLNIERPLSVDKIEHKMNEILWFQGPMLRQVSYIRKWGKKVARAVRNHEVFIGMPAEAAEESWGIPDDKNFNEIAGRKEEQWIFKGAQRSRYIYLTDGKVTKWEE
jgi:hypothetical protein